MINANIKIIKEIKNVFQIICSNSEIKNKFVMEETNFSRKTILSFEITCFMIISLLKKSLSVEIIEFFGNFNTKRIPTKAAFSIKRHKIKSEFFEFINLFFVEKFYLYNKKKLKKWRGFIVIAIDGSTSYLFDNQKVIDYFGTQNNQYKEVAMARIVKFFDVLNGITIFAKISPIKIGKQEITINNIDYLFEKSLSILDRGFASFSLMYLFINQEVEKHFVIRAKLDFNQKVREFVASDSWDSIVEMHPSKNSIDALYRQKISVFKHTKIKIRLIKILLKTGEIEVLMTNLYDENLYEISCFEELYFLRWGIETSYDFDKNSYQLEQFSGKSVLSIEQDFYALIFVSNIQNMIERQCEVTVNKINTTRKIKYKINKNVSIGVLKPKIVSLFFEQNTQFILEKLQHFFEFNLEPIRPNREILQEKKIRKKIINLKH